MSVELKIPEVGESVAEIYIGQWSKSEGERVEQDEPLVELESEKATLDLRAPSAGTLTKILKKSGETAGVGETIGYIEDRAQAPTQAPAPAPDSNRAAPQGAKEVKPRPPGVQQPTPPEQPTPPPREEPPPPPQEVPPASPSEQPTPPRREEPPPGPPEYKQRQPAGGRIGEAAAEDRIEPSRAEERVPMSPVRRRIAAHLVQAQQSAALLTTFNEIDLTAVKRLRAEHGEAFERKHGIRLGIMSFFVKATIDALGECAELNASIDGDDIIYHRFYDIGVAISSPKGLVVPVLRNADQMSFGAIERAIANLAIRAKEATLRVDELQGGTFTISNGGIFGSLLSTPIVNPPQSGVLGMHTIQERPVAHEGNVVIRPMMYVALTYDHRIVDGREAVSFLKRIKETIEDPARLLLEL
jgi:2-oxoglutarate dehydrogenase E2 component (dihydrolipoamide succinyltransferase)